MSKGCLVRLRHAMEVMNQIDMTAAGEEDDYSDDLYSDFTTEEDREQFSRFNDQLLARQPAVRSAKTEVEIMKYVCDPEAVTYWLFASKLISKKQNLYASGGTDVSDACCNRAQVFLVLAMSLIQCLQPIKRELQVDAEEVYLALKLKLHALQTFCPMSEKRPNRPGPLKEHPFITAVSAFDADDPVPRNVAEAYPTINEPVSYAFTGEHQVYVHCH